MVAAWAEEVRSKVVGGEEIPRRLDGMVVYGEDPRAGTLQGSRGAQGSAAEAPRAMSLQQCTCEGPPSIPLAELALINGLDGTARIHAGKPVKGVTGTVLVHAH